MNSDDELERAKAKLNEEWHALLAETDKKTSLAFEKAKREGRYVSRLDGIPLPEVQAIDAECKKKAEDIFRRYGELEKNAEKTAQD